MGHRILCVDDNERNLRILEELLSDDYETLCLPNGESAVAEFESFGPSIVLLDVMMPGMNGYETCRKLKSMAEVAVVLVTARAREDEREQGLDAGADAYLVKPFDPDALLDLVEGFPTGN